jgi:hypothetical protein
MEAREFFYIIVEELESMIRSSSFDLFNRYGIECQVATSPRLLRCKRTARHGSIRLKAVYHAARRVKPLSLSLTRLRLRDAENVGLIAVEKQPVFVCFSNTVPHRAQLLTTVRLSLAGPPDRWDRMLADG